MAADGPMTRGHGPVTRDTAQVTQPLGVSVPLGGPLATQRDRIRDLVS